jgi:SAM-dependent methyltransferase
MHRVEYDTVAPIYDRRYETNRFDELLARLRAFLGDRPLRSLAELGCGTGHWLQAVSALAHVRLVVGLDLSAAMLARAQARAGRAFLVRGSAGHLPWAAASFDRVFCINALHHFPNRDAVFRECARILRPAGAFLTVGLDPHAGLDAWWIYDYFPSALDADRARYPSTSAIRAGLAAAGFRRTEAGIAQRLPARMPFEMAEAQGLLDRRSTSQLMVISEPEWESGLARLQRDRPELRADLRLYATTAWV